MYGHPPSYVCLTLSLPRVTKTVSQYQYNVNQISGDNKEKNLRITR